MATARLTAAVEVQLHLTAPARAALLALGWTPPTTSETEPTDDLDITPYLVVHRYRTDQGHWAWCYRCWGDSDCDGHLALDLSDRTYAERKARQHVATAHAQDDAPTQH